MTDNERRVLNEWRESFEVGGGYLLARDVADMIEDLLEADSNTDVTPVRQNGDWIPWHGGEQPVPDGTPVEVWFRRGAVDSCEKAGDWYWQHNGSEYDIVAYRVIGYTPEPQPPAIPDGVPCWIKRPNGCRSVVVSDGAGGYYLHGKDRGGTVQAGHPMRPVCFEPWDKVPITVKAMALIYQHGIPASKWLNESEDPTPGNYYERRPR